MMLIADPLSIKNRTNIPSSANSHLKIDKVCTNAVELSWRTDSSVSVCWVISLSLSVFWTNGSFMSFFLANTFWLSETSGSKACIVKTSLSELDSDLEMQEEAVMWFNDSPWPAFDLHLCRETLSKRLFLCDFSCGSDYTFSLSVDIVPYEDNYSHT